MPHELTKPEKKLARVLIEKGVQLDYEKAIMDIDAIIADWKNKNTDTYRALYTTKTH